MAVRIARVALNVLRQRPRASQPRSHDSWEDYDARATAYFSCRGFTRHFAETAIVRSAEIILEQAGLLTRSKPLFDGFIFQLKRRRVRQGPLRFGSWFGHGASFYNKEHNELNGVYTSTHLPPEGEIEEEMNHARKLNDRI